MTTLKFPDRSFKCRFAARLPRRSKNGTPQEREAKRQSQGEIVPLSRRSILAGLLAVPAIGGTAALAAAPAPAVPAPEHVLPSAIGDDSKLLALEKRLKAASRRLARAEKESSDANDRANREEALMPPLPEQPQPPAEFADIWFKGTGREFDRLPKDHPLVVWERETAAERSAAWDMRHDRHAELWERCGYTAAHEKFERILHGEMWPIAREMFATPAHTAAGMMAKITAMKLLGIDEETNDEWRSIRKDIRAMAKRETGMVVGKVVQS